MSNNLFTKKNINCQLIYWVWNVRKQKIATARERLEPAQKSKPLRVCVYIAGERNPWQKNSAAI